MLDGTYTLMVTGMSNSGVNCVDIRYNSALVCSVNPGIDSEQQSRSDRLEDERSRLTAVHLDGKHS